MVIAAGWAGWGFDVFDAVLFNFVAPDCIPALLHLQPGSRAAHEATVFWTGAHGTWFSIDPVNDLTRCNLVRDLRQEFVRVVGPADGARPTCCAARRTAPIDDHRLDAHLSQVKRGAGAVDPRADDRDLDRRRHQSTGP